MRKDLVTAHVCPECYFGCGTHNQGCSLTQQEITPVRPVGDWPEVRVEIRPYIWWKAHVPPRVRRLLLAGTDPAHRYVDDHGVVRITLEENKL